MRHTIKNVEDRIISAIKAKAELESRGFSVIDGLKMNHVVMEWVLAQAQRRRGALERIAKVQKAAQDNVSLLDGLWALCAQHGIALDIEQQIALYQNFLDD
jgi:hypothetical protein